MTSPTVPPELFGCWQRTWIEFADGTRDDTSTVIWLQLQSKMADIRVSVDQPGHDRGSLAECSLDELRTLAESESSSGYTTCTPIVIGDDGARRATAEWFTRGHGVAFQPVSAFPEPGLLEWNDDGTVLYERAPSGAYVEEWRLIPGTSDGLQYAQRADGGELYVAGMVAVLVRDRPHAIPRAARLQELVAECGEDRDAIERLIDCEFSFARQHGSGYVVEASTLPWNIGKVIDVDLP
jgi:hypothetical protein